MIYEYSGRRFPIGRSFAYRWLLGRVRRSPLPDSIFCAELGATTHQRMGLLGNRRPPNWYDPGRFWSGDHIGLTSGASLRPEIAVSTDTTRSW